MRKFGWRFPLSSIIGISGSALIMTSAAVGAATTVSGDVYLPALVAILAGPREGAREEGSAIFWWLAILVGHFKSRAQNQQGTGKHYVDFLRTVLSTT